MIPFLIFSYSLKYYQKGNMQLPFKLLETEAESESFWNV